MLIIYLKEYICFLFNPLVIQRKRKSANTNQDLVMVCVQTCINLASVSTTIVLGSLQRVGLLCSEFKHLQVSQQFCLFPSQCVQTPVRRGETMGAVSSVTMYMAFDMEGVDEAD